MSANAVSLAGLALGTSAALAYSRWEMWPLAVVGLLLSVCWLVADGMDGMIARDEPGHEKACRWMNNPEICRIFYPSVP
ncbi:CDP-alcohol phosphatidyltransferase family protein, partial [Paenibacillus polymyxa]|nr:CDP-alcohol phosphatidyltransferase family protein [Paenibacillus polymyxa]